MRRIYAMALCLVLLMSFALWAYSTGGDEADPVVSRSYLETVFQPDLTEKAESEVQKGLTGVYNTALSALAEKTALGNLARYKAQLARRAFGKVVLKQNDVLLPLPGCKITLLGGSISADGSLINVTAGRPAEAWLQPKQLYMQSDAPSPGLTVQTATAEVLLAGAYGLTPSDATDYGSLADALTQMGLFKGMTEGYNLEGGTTRAQGLVMFLRLMGKEEEALKTAAELPFTDVPGTHWARPYVAYAYKSGLTTGVTETAFQPDAPVTAQHYVTFLLRALHYAENTDFSYTTVLTDAANLGLFSQTELSALSQGPFLRHKMVYLSYYSLFCPHGETSRLLLEDLISSGAVTEQNAHKGLACVRGWRMGEK